MPEDYLRQQEESNWGVTFLIILLFVCYGMGD